MLDALCHDFYSLSMLKRLKKYRKVIECIYVCAAALISTEPTKMCLISLEIKFSFIKQCFNAFNKGKLQLQHSGAFISNLIALENRRAAPL